MKRRLLLFLLVPILVLAITSCDADMRSNFAGFLGGLGGNVYIDSGMVEPNTADVKAAAQTIAGLGSGDGKAAVTAGGQIEAEVFGIAVNVAGKVDEDTPFMKPQSPADQSKMKDDLASALDSPSQTEELKKEMAKKVDDQDRKDAVKGTVKVLNATIDKIIEDAEGVEGSGIDGEIKEVLNKLKLSIDDEDDLTEGDVLMVQMMANLISNTVGTLNEIADGGELGDNLEGEGNKSKILSIVDDALFTAQIAEELSGASGIDFSGQLGLSDLFENMNRGLRSSRQSRDGEPDKPFEDAAEFLETINALGPELINLFGLKKIAGEYNWVDGGYRRFINTQQAYRGALEHAVALANKANIDTKTSLKGRGLTFDGSTAIKYLISVIITDANEWGADNPVEIDENEFENAARLLLREFVTANPWIATGTATVNTEMIDPDIDEDDIDFEAFGEELHGKGEDYIRGIFENAIVINDVGGLKPLSKAIEEFLEGTDFDDFLDNLGGN